MLASSSSCVSLALANDSSSSASSASEVSLPTGAEWTSAPDLWPPMPEPHESVIRLDTSSSPDSVPP
eukprot:12695434-Alexandrium_andersonii.AAC.1